MNELTKIKNVMKKVVPDAPDEVLLVLDGSTGQNALSKPNNLLWRRKLPLWPSLSLMEPPKVVL